jgi:hypothetical protein
MEWVRIHQLLKLYESASGQKLNVDKTSIFFSKNTKREFKEHIRFLVGTSATTSVQVSNQFQNFLQVYATCILMIAHHYRDSQMYRTRKDYVRNSLVFECTFTALSILVRHAKEQVEGFAQASEQWDATRVDAAIEHLSWKPPPFDMLKANWDAAKDYKSKVVGLGGNYSYTWGDSACCFLLNGPRNNDPTVAVALAVWWAISFCREQGWQQVLFEGDSQQVVLEMKMPNPCWNLHGNLIEDSKELLHGFVFVSASVQFVSQVANNAAHRLAKVALSQRLDQVWMDGCPPSIQSIVLAEQEFPLW